ncbi:hypothetical protein QJS04_geneDACA018381 [Acorus gramineus]|uniref:Ribosomal protein L19 n=1 Tax=Acorus gramineus TaxID=55184 RepID=A0AAV9AEK5_ACOGR|nr:hypothetical protein QJS04_geneDACA018381 [Acorus gramineus]
MASKMIISSSISTVPSLTLSSHSPKLGLSVFSSSLPSSFSSLRISTAASRSTVPGLKLSPFSVARRRTRSTVVRAQSGSGAAEEAPVPEEEAPENAEASSAPESEAVAKPPRQPRVKLGDIMGILNRRAIEESEKVRPVPDIRTGDIVEIKMEVPENRRRASIYKGIVISKQNAGIHTTIRIRRIIAGIGVEIVFPVYSPNIKELKVMKHRKVRRARLYYLRDKLPRLSTFK